MIRRIAGATALALLAALPHATAPQTAQAGLPLFGFPKKSKPPVVLLAEMIDDLEESLNDTGTIVAKKPDVWGESRLTKHREQVEEQLKEQLKKFQPVLSGTSVMTDQAFLANALAIQAAIGPQGRIPTWTSSGYQFTPPNNTAVTVANVPVTQSVMSTDDKPVTATNSEGGPTIVGTAPGGFSLTSSLRGNVNTNEANLGFAEGGKLTLEPTVRVDQLKRYLDHLNELRRLNEGGDTADAPGYSLNLVRIPVSIMPGDDTRKGHGAEITVTAEMHLTRELLPTTFRSMVVQDLMDELSLPVVKLADIASQRVRNNEALKRASELHAKASADRHQAQVSLKQAQSHKSQIVARWTAINGELVKLNDTLKSQENDIPKIVEHLVLLSEYIAMDPESNEHVVEVLNKELAGTKDALAMLYYEIIKILDRKLLVSYPDVEIRKNKKSGDLSKAIDDFRSKIAHESADDIYLKFVKTSPPAPDGGQQSGFQNSDGNGTSGPPSSAAFDERAYIQWRSNWMDREDWRNNSDLGQEMDNPASSSQTQQGVITNKAGGDEDDRPIPVEAGNPHLDMMKAMTADAEKLFKDYENKYKDRFKTSLDSIQETIGGVQQSLADRNSYLARNATAQATAAEDAAKSMEAAVKNAQDLVVELNEANIQAMASALRPGSPTRRSRLPIPPTQIACVFGENELLEIANRFQMATHNNCTEARLSEARAFLKEELEAAYDYLKTPAAQFCWERVPEIAMAVRTGNEGGLARLRLDVVTGLCGSTSPVPGVTDGQCSPATCGILALMAWPILVEAALLDQRLNEDLLRVAQDPECECLVTGPQCFYLPDPPEEARMAFMDYVRCRWPIHVFALDPQTQDQNVAQASSIRRELQLAAALAFASGRVGASNTLRFVRRLELEEQAIALNRTAIAFAHGANTFGWRFRPRFQTMDIESNAVTVGRDLLWGGPNRDARMKNWRIEPGMRECVALVVMPSFVPHVRFDVRSHWFKLHNHDNIKGEMTDTMKLSSKIAEAQQLMEFCHLEAENYRPGEIERLYARVKQLSDRLPLQTMYAQVPYENTAGGFELFSSGVTDLGPELLDYYGAPGVSRNRQTTLFLVGRNFSVHNSVVIAGNRTCETELLSRDVMQVTIPADSQTVFCSREGKVSDDPCAKCRGVGPCGAGCYEAVEIHLATPYGVSGQLFVPVYQEVPVAPSPEPAGPSPEEIKAEAVDAAKKLVHGHQAVFHPVTYAWSTPAVKATYLLDTCGRPSDLCLHVDSLAVVPSGATPFGPHQSLSFAARVEAVDSKGQVVAYQSSIAPSLVSMTNSTFPLYAASGVAGPHFAAQLATVVANEPELTLKASKLRVHGFVQIGDPTLPPVQLTNVLEIEIGARSVGGVGVVPCPTCPSGAATGAASVPIGENVGHVNLPAATSESLGVSEVFVGGESGSVTGPGFLSESTETRAPSATGPEIPTVPTTPTPGLSKVFLPPNTGAPEISEGPRFE